MSVFSLIDAEADRLNAESYGRTVAKLVVESLAAMAADHHASLDVVVPICNGCLYYEGQAEQYARPTCAAFPAGIPDAILNSEVDHREPYAGDGGATFTASDADAEAYAHEVFGSRQTAHGQTGKAPVIVRGIVLRTEA